MRRCLTVAVGKKSAGTEVIRRRLRTDSKDIYRSRLAPSSRAECRGILKSCRI